MIHYKIDEPIWGTRSVGLATHRVGANTVIEVTIAKRDKHDNLIYPFCYRMHTMKVRSYPTQRINSGIFVHIVPIEDFEKIP